jgi:hypothetical protein
MTALPPTKPRRDFLGFCKSIVDFFTSLTGATAAALGILGTIIAFVLVPGPTPTPNPPGPVANTDLAAINQVCDSARREVADAGNGSGPTGDPVADAAAAERRVASRLAGIRVSSADDEALQAAMTELRDAADALEIGGDYATPDASAASLLQSIGATC